MHLEYYNRPRLQIRVVRILCMVPIYAIDSWLSLRFKEARFYIDPVRECYEAFVIYNFFMYLVGGWVGGGAGRVCVMGWVGVGGWVRGVEGAASSSTTSSCTCWVGRWGVEGNGVGGGWTRWRGWVG